MSCGRKADAGGFARTEAIDMHTGGRMNPYYEKRSGRLQVGVSENMNFPAHLHDDVEMLYCLEGGIRVTIMGETRLITPGECAVIFPERVHSYLSEDNSRILLLIFGTSMSGTYGRTIQKYYPENPFLEKKEIPADARLAFRRLCSKEVHRDDKLCLAWIQVILASLFPKLTLCEDERPEDMDLTYRLVRYVMEHFQEPLTLEELARKLHVNKYYLSHTFSGRLQMNFREYLNRIRLDYAMQQIRSSTGKPLTEIWEEAGFESQRSFNRIFREAAGISPKEYRSRES